MPFLKQADRPFTKYFIESLDTNRMGVYGIFNKNKCIYIGRGDIRKRLLDHLNGDNQCILSLKPTHWFGEITTEMFERERELIRELHPVCNESSG